MAPVGVSTWNAISLGFQLFTSTVPVPSTIFTLVKPSADSPILPIRDSSAGSCRETTHLGRNSLTSLFSSSCRLVGLCTVAGEKSLVPYPLCAHSNAYPSHPIIINNVSQLIRPADSEVSFGDDIPTATSAAVATHRTVLNRKGN